MTYGRLPPPSGPVLAPLSSGASFRAAMTLWAPCRRLASATQLLFWQLAGAGTWLLPTRRVDAKLNELIDGWGGLSSRLKSDLGAFDQVAYYRPAQAERTSFALLLLAEEHPLAFVKADQVGDHAEAREILGRQSEVLSAVAGSASFWSPRPLSSGSEENWSFLAMEALPPVRHRPGRHIHLGEVLSEMRARLAPVLPGEGVPDRWQPMHGDFGPWNVSDTAGRGPFVLDWEHVGWGPEGADGVFFNAACSAFGWHVPPPDGFSSETIEFWEDEIATRFGRDLRDVRLANAMLKSLRILRPT